MNRRRIVLALTIGGVIAGSATAALAGTPSVSHPQHQICIVTTDDPTHPSGGYYYCVSWDDPTAP